VTIRKSNGVDITFGADCVNSFFTSVGINAVPGVELFNPDEPFAQTLHYTFGDIIDIKDISSITIGNTTITVNE
jgi:hypothetical protein